MRTGSTHVVPDTSSRPVRDFDTALREAAASFGVDLVAAPSPIATEALFSACGAAECLASEVLERVDEIMNEGLPSFGLIQIEHGVGALGACLGHQPNEEIDDMDAHTLRRLAADALAAAEWLDEARR